MSYPQAHRSRPMLEAAAAARGPLVAVAVATHVIAASLLYSHLVRVLYSLIEGAPRLAPLERGLVRILAASVYLPPFAPSVLLIAAVLWAGSARRDPRVARWLSYGVLAVAFDSLLRLIGVWFAATPANVGELLDLPARFSPGPRMFAELAGVPVVGSAAIYWSVVCSLAAIATVICVSRALLFAEDASADPGERRRRQARGQTISAVQNGIVTVVAFVVIAFLGQLALPVATHLFLRTFG